MPRLRAPLALLAALMALPALPQVAAAQDMNVSLARLRVSPDAAPDCGDTGDNGLPRQWCADLPAWRSLASQLGFSLIPPVLSPARTTGYGGLYVGVEGWITGIDSGASYWERGTEGDDGLAGDTPNRFASGPLIWSRFNVRKGFPFGFELGTSFAKLLDTDYWAWGLEVKWALFEGFRYGLGILPDVAVRGMVNTMVGEPEFNVTVPSFDVVVSKRITVAGTGTITPMISYQLAWIFADSELVDLTPDIDAFDECLPASDAATTVCSRPTPDRDGDGEADPVEHPDGSTYWPGEDYNNNTTFDQLRALRQRLVLGVQGQYQALTLTASFAFDLQKPGDQDEEVPDGLPRQWSVAAGAGLQF